MDGGKQTRPGQLDLLADRFSSATDSEGVFKVFSEEIARLGYTSYFYAQLHATPEGEMVGVASHTSMNDDFVAGYMDARMYEADVIVKHCINANRPMLWSELERSRKGAVLSRREIELIDYVFDNGYRAGTALAISRGNGPLGKTMTGISLIQDKDTDRAEHEREFGETSGTVKNILGFLSACIDAQEVSDNHFGLTEIERRILVRLARGDQGQQVADALLMPDRTVAWHMRNLRRKLRARTNAQAVALAILHNQI